MTWTPPTLEEAWDALIATCAAEGVTIETPALIESGASGRRVRQIDPPRHAKVLPPAPVVS